MPELIEQCTLCPRMCGARRDAKSGNGFCRMGVKPVVARAALHAWEEPCISGNKGPYSLQAVPCNAFSARMSRSACAARWVVP